MTNRPELRSEVYLRRDIADILRALDVAGAVLDGVPMPELWAWRAGYVAALGAVGVAFGVEPAAPCRALLERGQPWAT